MLCDGLGNPVRFLVTPGQRGDVTQAEALLEGIKAGAVIADKAYDADPLVDRIAAEGAEVVIPPKRNRTEQRGYDKNLYADRNKVERLFNRLKHYRRVATRYEKTAESFLAMVQVAAIMTWLL